MEAWLKNPHSYIQEAVREGWNLFAWQYGALDKRGIDPIRHLKMFGGLNEKSRILLIGDQGTAEVTQKAARRANPKALYPTWEYGLNPLHLLEKWVTFNEDPKQEHRVVLTMLPSMVTPQGKRFLAYVTELQEENPETIIHLHGLTRFRIGAISGVASMDWEPHTIARGGGVVLPNGRSVQRWEESKKWRKWCLKNGMLPIELSDPKKRCVFNIRSYKWASDYWNGEIPRSAQPPEGHEKLFQQRNPELVTKASLGRGRVGDFLICNHCTKWKKCALYREGQVCTVSDSPGAKFSQHFKSKDPDTILDGILEIVADDYDRYEKAKKNEDIGQNGIDPEVTKLANQIKKTGFDIAKLRQPKGPLVKNIMVGGAANAVITDGTGSTEMDAHQILANAIAALEAAGWDRADVTEDHLKSYLDTGKIPMQAPSQLTAVAEPMDAAIEVESTES